MKAKWRYRFAKLEFSKKLAVAVTALFIFCIVFSLIAWLIKGEAPIQVLEPVASSFTIVLTGYFLKAGTENYKKISKHDQAVPEVNPEEYVPHEQEL